MLPIFKTSREIEDAAEFVVNSVLNQLKLGKKVLLFLTGGSSVAVGVKIGEILRGSAGENLLQNLTVTLTDERYGPINHKDSNWHQLLEKGFSLPGAKIIPILINEDRNSTVEKFNKNLNEEFTKSDYKIGLFGIGADGHTAGVLPDSSAVSALTLGFGYDTATFSRITITFSAIERLDEAVVWAQGKDKWKILGELQTDMNVANQPAQILKKIPSLTIFSDYQI